MKVGNDDIKIRHRPRSFIRKKILGHVRNRRGGFGSVFWVGGGEEEEGGIERSLIYIHMTPLKEELSLTELSKTSRKNQMV